MKKLLFMLLAFLPLSIWADPVKIDDLYYELDEASFTATVTSHPNEGGYNGDIVIPSTVIYDGITYCVTSIGEMAFYYNTSMTSINMPSTVKNIESEAFRGCEGLKSLSIPVSVTNIGDYAFEGCNGLTSIVIPVNVTNIGNHIIENCCNLVSVSVESGNTVYDSRNNCNAIIKSSSHTLISGCKNTIIPNSITSIGEYAFAYCVLTSINIPNSVTSIGEYAFAYCEKLTSVDIPNSVTIIGDWAFSDCYGLTSINIGNGVTSIGTGTFNSCFSLITIDIPSNVESIGTQAFFLCGSLTSINIPNSVTSIGDNAFAFCEKLTSVDIPNSVTSIGEYAFAGCEGLAKVICEATTPPSCDINTYNGVNLSQATLYVPATSIETYRTTYPWSEFGKIQPINIDITIGSTGYATYCSEYDLDFNTITDFKAYIVVGYNKNTGNVTVVSVKDAPAGTGLLLKGTSGTYQVPCGESGSIYSNMLVGVIEETIINATDGTYTNFTLQNGSKGVGFYAIMDNHKMAAHRAYLQIPNNMLSSSANQVGLEFEEGMTSINETNMVEDGNAIWFSLDGRQFNSKPTKKGVYVTNGRKVVIK